MPDETINPPYYIRQFEGHEIDVFAIAELWDLDYPRGNALKYLLRAGNKPGNAAVKDLRKAIRCIERALEIAALHGETDDV